MGFLRYLSVLKISEHVLYHIFKEKASLIRCTISENPVNNPPRAKEKEPV